MTISDLNSINNIVEILESFWLFDTKELLLENDIQTGLLDYGLFTDKIPPCFCSVGLSSFAENELGNALDEHDEKRLKKNTDKCSHDYIRYESLRDTNISRGMGIPHPESYALQVLAIKKHWKEITQHCNKPDINFSKIFVRKINGSARIFEMNYKGSEKYDNEEEEILWRSETSYIVKADIASCFPSIYTHSIPWALHGKLVAKNSNNLLITGNLLDKCTQNTKDKQTNGLIIGPHASNIISEIILTTIDYQLQLLGYKKVIRHIDDYIFYASSFDESERFIKDLNLLLRNFEMSLNDKKTSILPLPRPFLDDWVNEINAFSFKNEDQGIKFSQIRAFLDLSLRLSQRISKSTPLNYTIKVIASKIAPESLSERTRRMYTQEAINLSIFYPYLVPILEKNVFEKFPHDELINQIGDLTKSLIRIGIKKLYPDIISYALYYALKYQIKIKVTEDELLEILKIDDCLSIVSLYHYAQKNNLKKIIKELNKKSQELKKLDHREHDKQWLFIYYLWTEADLKGKGQDFLAKLKNKKFEFFSLTIDTKDLNKTRSNQETDPNTISKLSSSRVGENLIVSPKRPTWNDFFSAPSAFGDDFLAERDNAPAQEREWH